MLHSIRTRIHAHEEIERGRDCTIHSLYNTYCLVYIIAIVCHLTRNDNSVDAKFHCDRTKPHRIKRLPPKQSIIYSLQHAPTFMHISNSMSSSGRYFFIQNAKKCLTLEIQKIFINAICTGQREREKQLKRQRESNWIKTNMDESAVNLSSSLYLFRARSLLSCHSDAIKYKYSNSNIKSDDKSLLFSIVGVSVVCDFMCPFNGKPNVCLFVYALDWDVVIRFCTLFRFLRGMHIA